MRERMFANLDANGDNSIDKSEFGKAQESAGMGRGGMPSADKMFAKVDGNGDGKLTKDELKSFEERVSSEMKSVLIGAQSDASG
ncbi:MAG: EF-hand domain-containing protein, partial [Azospirillum sp.]|nr:EF-hand domain-containing protein [Azospirillum sp.]